MTLNTQEVHYLIGHLVTMDFGLSRAIRLKSANIHAPGGIRTGTNDICTQHTSSSSINYSQKHYTAYTFHLQKPVHSYRNKNHHPFSVIRFSWSHSTYNRRNHRCPTILLFFHIFTRGNLTGDPPKLLFFSLSQLSQSWIERRASTHATKCKNTQL